MRDFEMAKQLISCLDLTSLNKDDNETSITKLCERAVTPCGNVAAVCVYSKFIPLVQKLLENTDISIATVVNFPEGGTDIEATIEEIKNAIAYGADEIDAVFPYKSFLEGDIETCRNFMDAVSNECKNNKLKIILESGAFPHITQLQNACSLCMEYEIDFLKTSTGKTEVSATPEAANAILETIHNTPRHVGFKASGGIKTFEQARKYYIIAQSIFGETWTTSEHFRIGASSVLDDLLKVIKKGI